MPDDHALAALSLFLPDKALDHFDITKADIIEGTVHLTLTEKNIPPPSEKPLRFHSYRDLTLADFPVRGKPAVITFKRRYWQDGDKGALVANSFSHSFPGTRLEKAFADFLKGGGGE